MSGPFIPRLWLIATVASAGVGCVDRGAHAHDAHAKDAASDAASTSPGPHAGMDASPPASDPAAVGGDAATTPRAGTGAAGHTADAAQHALDATANGSDAGTVTSASDEAGVTITPILQWGPPVDCQLAGPVPRIAADGGWLLVRCADQLGRLTLDDLSFAELAPVTATLTDTRITAHHVLYIEGGALKSVPISGGAVKTLAASVTGIFVVTSNPERVVFSSSERALLACLVSGEAAAVTLVGADFSQYVDISADSSRVIYTTGSVDGDQSIAITGGSPLTLGKDVRSRDNAQFATLDPTTQTVVVRWIDGTHRVDWTEPGYAPSAVQTFTQDSNGLVLADTDGRRLISLTGGPATRLDKVKVPSGQNDSRAVEFSAPAALFQYCHGNCRNDNGGFNLVPLSGAPAQHHDLDTCYVDRIDMFYQSLFISPDQTSALFWDLQGNIVVANGTALTTQVVATNAGYVCYQEQPVGWSPDSRKLYYDPCVSTDNGRCTLSIVGIGGELLNRLSDAGRPVFSPNSRRALVATSDELQVLTLGDPTPRFRVSAPDKFDPIRFAWADGDRFIYADQAGIRVVRLAHE